MPLPFRPPTTPAAFFTECPAGIAEQKLSYAIDEGLDAAILVGAPGLGKTTVLRRLAEHARRSGNVLVDVFFPQVVVDGLVAFLDSELSGATTDDRRDARLRRIADCVRELGRQRRGVVLMVDDAHLVSDATIFDALPGLLNLRDREGARVTAILSGQAPLLARLAEFPGLSQRIAVAATLTPLSEPDTASYIRHRLRTAGQEETLFAGESLVALYETSRGVPRIIDRICEMAMIVAASAGRALVCAEDIRVVSGELAVPVREAA